MNLIFRLIKVLLGTLGRTPLGLLEESVVEFRVWPNDLHLNRHLTTSRYFAHMDPARNDMVNRSGAYKAWRRNGWFPVVASQRIRFRKSLAPWAKYLIRTRTLGKSTR